VDRAITRSTSRETDGAEEREEVEDDEEAEEG
jgi:hypothetical protein